MDSAEDMVADTELDTAVLAEDTVLDLAASVVDTEEDMAALAEDTAASAEDMEEDTPPDLYLLSLSAEVTDTVQDTVREAVSEEEDTVVALVEATDTDAHTVEY